MTFRFYLTPPRSSVVNLEGTLEHEEAVDDFESLVVIACGQLAETDCKFHFGGFGRDDWDMDVSYDMSTFVEQLPSALESVRRRDQGVVDLYSQGVECLLRFTPIGSDVEVQCVSRTKWMPEPEFERVEMVQLERMASQLASEFANSLAMVKSPIIEIEPFSSWLTGRIL